MDFNFTPEDEAFRREVREFVAASLPVDISEKVLRGKRLAKEDFSRWHTILYQKGWIAPSWPTEFGGTDWNAVRQYIFEEELALAGAPPVMPFSLRMVAPVIMAFGSKAQQEYFLPKILSGEHWWCQGYSEPGAGSDLASLKTRAERHGDKYIVNGQKTWTTLAQHANWIFCLVRTGDPGSRPQEGISFLLIDMQTPGVTVRPIVMLDGEHEINEVWFENVEVPAQNRVGEENKGWTYAKYLLGHERTGNAGVGYCKRELKSLKEIASTEKAGGRPLIEDVRFREKIGQVEIDLMALEITNLRVIAAEAQRRAPGPEASMLKVKGSEIQQALSELKMQALGHYAIPYQHDAMAIDYDGPLAGPDYGVPVAGHYFNYRKASIYAGSNEIQHNIIAKMILGF